MKYIAFDTETYLIQQGMMAPPLVCVTMADKERSVFGVSTGDADLQETVESLFEPGLTLLGQNASFDLAVIGKAYPHLIPKIWQKLEAGEVVDVRIRDMLMNLGTHGKLKYLHLPDGTKEMITYSLADLVMRYMGIDLGAEKKMEDAWRFRYNELDNIPFDDFPAEARHYAIMDALYVVDVYEAQNARHEEIMKDRGLDLLEPAPFQTAIDFALQVITGRGMGVDEEEVEKIEKMLAEEFHDLEKFPLLLEHAIIRQPVPARVHSRQLKKVETFMEENGYAGNPAQHREALEAEGFKFTQPKAASLCRTNLITRVRKTCETTRTEIKKTEKGGVSTDSEVIMNLAPYDLVLKEYQARQALAKLVTTEMPAMYYRDSVTDVIYFNYNVLLETGRTSSFGSSKDYASRNGQQVDPRTRPCFVPRDDRWLLSVDYSSLELCSTGHVTKILLGESEHHAKVCAGYNMHAFLGAQLAYALHDEFRATCVQMGIAGERDEIYRFFLSLEHHEDERLQDFFAHWRKFAKPVGLGYPGGLGAKTFVTLAHKAYGVDLVEEAAKLPPEFFDEFVFNRTVTYHGKRMGLVEDNQVTEWTPKLRAIAFAQHLKEIWLDTYPEMRAYFAHVRECEDEFNLRTVRDPETDEEEARPALCYTSPMGMHRANCTYTQAANGQALQTPSAEGFKIAFFNVVRACHDPSVGSVLHKMGCHVVNEIHDEILVEVPNKIVAANCCVKEVQKIMKESMEMVLYTVPIETEAALMLRWNKKAKPVFSGDLLVPWEPKEEKSA